jgi:3-methylcrotonyl-CoA carboxylase alpha subunit
MFSSVLIANRGEIACRIARTARRLGLHTIAVYSDADRNALHVRCCDEAHHIGGSAPADSYLSIEKLIDAIRRSGAQCVHPGYGFLAENPEFAEACAKAGPVFVGPPPSAIRAMGLKDAAKAIMEKAGVPVVPGYHGEKQTLAFLSEQAARIGFPVMIKPVAGGGGKGMRRVDEPKAFEEALGGAMREAQSAFGDRRVLIEKFIESPRHIEIQVFADTHGNVIHLNERDCSLQRRHQKIIEESPAPGMSESLRAKMGLAATQAAHAVGYVGAGTVEFIASGARGLREDGFWFMEMNTRLQVEHPVTEAVTGIDLVEWQFRIAAGEALPLRQDEVPLRGHAVEARIYAEDPEHGFVPSTGRLHAAEWPTGDGLRVDAGVETGSEVTPYYDPMLAKLIAHDASREQALDRLAGALEQTIVAGPRSNVAFLIALCNDQNFRKQKFDTGYIDRALPRLLQLRNPDNAAIAAGVTSLLQEENERLDKATRASGTRFSPWDVRDAFQLSGTRVVPISAQAGRERVSAQATFDASGTRVTVGGEPPAADARMIPAARGVYVIHKGRQTLVELDHGNLDLEAAETGGIVRAPMHGKLLAVFVEKGAQVEKGQRLAVIEAMKMEHTLTAPTDGVVAALAGKAGGQVAEGEMLITIEAAD